MSTNTTGQIASINISGGGVPKHPVATALISVNGVDGDAQSNTRHHGGPERAVCLFGLEVIALLRADGHPIEPGWAGENLTISGVHWPDLAPGARLRFEHGV